MARGSLSRQPVGRDELARVVDYEKLADAVRGIVASGHVRLVETLAERIAEACLADRRVHLARVRVEKLDIFPDAASAGRGNRAPAERLVHVLNGCGILRIRRGEVAVSLHTTIQCACRINRLAAA